jgi:hypothetical protein
MLVEMLNKPTACWTTSLSQTPMKTFRLVFSRIRSSTLFIVSAVALAGQPSPATPSLCDADITRRYLERRETIITSAIATLDAADTAKGSYLDVAAALQRGDRRAAALARLALLNAPTPNGNMFWMYPMAAVVTAGREGLDAASWARIQELWKTYWPSRGDTENHWAIYYASLYVVAQAFAGAGPEQWFNGQSSAENMAESRAYLEHWMRVTTTVGQGEYDSPGYIGEYVVPLSLLAGWAEDAAFRQKACMMLDYIFYDYAIEQLNGQYAGAHSRVYPRQVLQPAQVAASSFGWLLFGLGERQPRGQALLLTLSGYTPPPILERIARAAARPYVNRELKRTRWRMRHAGPDAITVGDRRTVPVYKYSYVDRDFVLGSSQGGLLQPIQQQTWNLRWHVDQPLDASNTFFAVQPYSSPYEGTMFFGADWDTVTELIARSKADYDSPDKLASGSPHEQVFQHGPALIGLYDLPPDTRFPHIITLFSRDLRQVTEDASGWIFAQGGPVYIAYRPLAAGTWKPNDWTGHLAGGAGGFISAGFKEWGVGHRCYVSGAQHNGYVVQVAPVRDFPSYAKFQDAVRALPLQFSTSPMAAVTFTALDGSVLHARYGATPTVNTKPVDYAAWPLFASPSGWAERGSQQLELRHGAERYRLDFEHNVITHAIAQP